MTDKGVFYLVHNRTYLGQVRWGGVANDEAHPALVSKALWRKCQGKTKRSARTGELTGQFLPQGVATCAGCGRALYFSSGGRKRDKPFYYCRNPEVRRAGICEPFSEAALLGSRTKSDVFYRLTTIDGRTSRLTSARFGGDEVCLAGAGRGLACMCHRQAPGYVSRYRLRWLTGPTHLPFPTRICPAEALNPIGLGRRA